MCILSYLGICKSMVFYIWKNSHHGMSCLCQYSGIFLALALVASATSLDIM